MSADSFLQSMWYGGKAAVLSLLLVPLSLAFAVVATLRRGAYALGVLPVHHVSRPVIVVGNVTVGGTGKTPLVMWLADRLRQAGRVPGIVLRGYGGGSATWPLDVSPDSDPREVGDEAVLLATQSAGIVVAGPDRVAAARRAIERGADIILADDGLQHYRLARDVEIAVIDGERRLGNGRLLPAGPLREPASRLGRVDLVAVRQEGATTTWVEGPEIRFHLEPTAVRHLLSGEVATLARFRGVPVHAVAGIGHPARFFAALEAAGIPVQGHPMPDHAALGAADLAFGDAKPVLVTAKDAVKLRQLDDPRIWVVEAAVRLAEADAARLLAVVRARTGADA